MFHFALNCPFLSGDLGPNTQENLLHGTLPWRAAHERRTILYKYSPNAVAFSHQLVEGEQGFVPQEVRDELTPLQRGLLMPPYAGYSPPGEPPRPSIREELAKL